jgi:protein SCO1/2
MKWHHKAFIFVFSVIIIALLVGVWRNNGENSTSSKMMLRAGTILTVPRTMPDFKFIDQHGETFTQEALHNRWTFLFFGYTHCPEICPETLRVLSKISEKVGHSQQIGFVFITIDPTHDTPERLTQFFCATALC